MEYSKAIEENRSKISAGPWMEEPNRVNFVYRGFDCAIIRNPFLYNLCGYVKIPMHHPLFQKNYCDYNEVGDLKVHGGITYSNDQLPFADNADEWWIGFDCGHSWDLIPSMDKTGIYRDVAYVARQLKELVEQL